MQHEWYAERLSSFDSLSLFGEPPDHAGEIRSEDPAQNDDVQHKPTIPQRGR